jgi:hypothetical protein
VVQLDNLGNLLEPFLELLDLLEVVAELDHRRGLEHAALVEKELTVLQRVDVALDQEQIGTGFDWQEARPWDVDAMAVLEVLDGCAGGGLELDDGLAIFVGFGINYDLKLQTLGLHDALERWKIVSMVQE